MLVITLGDDLVTDCLVDTFDTKFADFSIRENHHMVVILSTVWGSAYKSQPPDNRCSLGILCLVSFPSFSFGLFISWRIIPRLAFAAEKTEFVTS